MEKKRRARYLFLIIFVIFIICVAIAAITLSTTKSSTQGAYFDGTHYFLLNSTLPNNFTVSLWAFYTSFNRTGVIISEGEGENLHSGWYIGTGGEIDNKTMCGVFSDQILQNNLTAGWSFAQAPFIGTGKWYNIVCVHNTSSISLYLNGKLINRTATPYTAIQSKVMEIGKRTSTFYINNAPTFAPFFGYVTNINIYDKPLSDSEIGLIYSDGIAGAPPGNVHIVIPLRNSSDAEYFVDGVRYYMESENISNS